jgi:hypothetical protein|tara:strand:- start:558 stop:1232 length:675 start_codon:yes stop_codon:yes gene_type:complete
MAINVNTVYQTVLLILNKEQRGYITPDEFNKVATQVQLQILEDYFEDLNQVSRIQQNDMDYSDRVSAVDEKISVFRQEAVVNRDTATTNVYRLGTVTYNGIELQRVQRNDYYNIVKSPLLAPSLKQPIYLYQDNKILSYPITATPVNIDFIGAPAQPVWGFTVNANTGVYLHSPVASTDFTLMPSEQSNVIIKILSYSGIIIRDPSIIQAAAQEAQRTEINSKR